MESTLPSSLGCRCGACHRATPHCRAKRRERERERERESIVGLLTVALSQPHGT
ncbi:hypothetical protein JZ751_001832 [Albula glossodonta]|uniref:Uncharacterized protein n=1 Tax=Albula glossodonta TaxID=121402 RepID=A0A8T2PUU5_9TELE|nr:hypothetical protein JZ751_001832 [Albula glossodonta]